MAHGLPDWGLIGPKETTYGLNDHGELAVRLGSPVVWDRRGDVFLMDSFEEGLGKLTITPFGTGATYNLTTYDVWHGDYALELTAGNDGLVHGVNLMWATPLPRNSNLGWEVWFSMSEHTSLVQLGFILYENPNYFTAMVRYDHVNKRLEYINELGAWIIIVANINLLELTKPIHTLKLVANPGTQNYVRVILDDIQYSLTGCVLPMGAWVGQNYLISTVNYVGVLGNNPKLTIDNVVFTENEPS